MAREPMNVVDTAWLRMDSAENLMVINGLLVFEEPMSRADFQSILEERLLAKHKRFRQRPVSEGNQYFWEEMPAVDMGYHLSALDELPETCSDSDLRASDQCACARGAGSRQAAVAFLFCPPL